MKVLLKQKQYTKSQIRKIKKEINSGQKLSKDYNRNLDAIGRNICKFFATQKDESIRESYMVKMKLKTTQIQKNLSDLTKILEINTIKLSKKEALLNELNESLIRHAEKSTLPIRSIAIEKPQEAQIYKNVS